MARKAGSKNRNYPPLPLEEALEVPGAIQHEASGMKVGKLTLAELLDTTPTSSAFSTRVASSRLFGLTEGGIRSDEFSITDLGVRAVSDDPAESAAALKEAILNVPPYKVFFEAFKGKKVPGATPMREFLTRDAQVDETHVEEVVGHILKDAASAGFLRKVKSAEYVDFEGVPDIPEDDEDEQDPVLDDEMETTEEDRQPPEDDDEDDPIPGAPKRTRPNAIFLGHGKNKKPRDQLTKILSEYGIPFKIAEEEPNRGRPIPIKVKETMEECGAAILIFSADEELFDKDGNSVWRPSENVVNELGAASIQYDSRIIIFREESVNLATNYESIGYITFEHDDLMAKANDLFRELISFGILKVSVSDD
jgi:predicted nucleotide-binding protein